MTPNTLIESAKVNANFAELKVKTDYLSAPVDWVTVTYLNSWVTYNATYHPIQYYKDALGFVHLRGMCKSGTSGIIATLPAGFRPGKFEIFEISTNSFAAGCVEIQTDGDIQAVTYSNTWVSLSGITFKAEA
jgi:hypothetical protein